MRKVAIYIISDGIGGAEQVVWQTIKSLDSEDSVYLIVNNEIAYYYENYIHASNLLNIGNIYIQSIISWKILRRLFNNRFINFSKWAVILKKRSIRRFLQLNTIEIIHCHLEFSLFSALKIKKKYRFFELFYSVHSTVGLLNDPKLKLPLSLDQFDFKLVDKLVFVYKNAYESFKLSKIHINNYCIIYNTISYESHSDFIREGIEGQEFRILYVGGSKFIKGYDILVETIALLVQSSIKINIKVIVIGPIENHSTLMKIIHYRNLEKYFEVHGFVPPPLHLEHFIKAHVLFMPSRSEALPVAALEAIQYDLPVIANAVGGVPEVIFHGENGFLGNNDPVLYAKLFQDLFNNYKDYLGLIKISNNKIRQVYSPSKMRAELLDIYS